MGWGILGRALGFLAGVSSGSLAPGLPGSPSLPSRPPAERACPKCGTLTRRRYCPSCKARVEPPRDKTSPTRGLAGETPPRD